MRRPTFAYAIIKGRDRLEPGLCQRFYLLILVCIIELVYAKSFAEAKISNDKELAQPESQ